MKNILAALVILLAGIMPPRAAVSTPVLRVTRLTGPIYLVEDVHYVATNSLVYIGPASVTVVGATWTPDTARLLAAQIRKLTNRPIRNVIDSSPDPEWSGGNAYWKRIGAKIVAIQETYTFLQRHWMATVAAMRKNIPTYPNLLLVLPTEVHKDNFSLQHGDVRGFYLGPSHTAADIFVWFPNERVLDAGSILKEHLGNMAKADVEHYPNTLHKLKAMHLPIRMIISGHWSAVHGPELIDQYLAMLAQEAPRAAHP